MKTLDTEALIRRSISIPIYFVSAGLLTVLFPILLPAMALISTFPKTRGALPTFLFVLGYLWYDTFGIIRCAFISVRWRNSEEQFIRNFRLQCQIIDWLKKLAEKLYRLNITVINQEVTQLGPAIILPRHASIADTIIPFVYMAIPEDIHLRYVLKKELLIDPIFDILGNRLPNYFVDRSGQDTQAAVKGIAKLAQTTTKKEGLVIYPEGSRFSENKRKKIRQKHHNNPGLMQQLDRWPSLLPPRQAGTMALLDNNPGLDLIFCVHAGFEGSSHFSSLLNGSWIKANILIKFWRIPFEDIPTAKMEKRDFLFEQWDEMETQLKLLRSTLEKK